MIRRRWSARRPSSVSPDDRRLYVACNYGNSLRVSDAATLTQVKETPLGKGAYNMEPSSDGKLVIGADPGAVGLQTSTH